MTQLETPTQTPKESRQKMVELQRKRRKTAKGAESDDVESEAESDEPAVEAEAEADETEPSWKRNAPFLARYLLRRDDPRAATHSSLVGGKYYIPLEMRPEFYRRYYEEFITLAPPSLFLTERYNQEPFRFFVDIDFKFDDIGVPKHVDVIAQLRAALAAKWDGYFGGVDFGGLGKPTVELFPCRAARRTDWKLHVIFHKLIVDWKNAMKIGQTVQAKLEEAGHTYKLDPLVYTKGSLRMVGSFKKDEVTPSHERENEFTYTPIDIESGEELEVTEATMEEFSIFLPESQLRCVNESVDFMAEDGSINFTTGDGDTDDDDAVYKGIGNVAPDSPLYKCIQEHYGENMARGADKIVQIGNSLTITMKSTFCPLFGHAHGSQHAYITLSRAGMHMKCHSVKREACRKAGELIPSKDLPQEVLDMVPAKVVECFYKNPEQNAAFIRSFSGTDRDIAEFAQFDLRTAFVAVNTKNNDSTWWHYANGRWNNAAAGTRLFNALNRLPLVYEEVASKEEDEKERKLLANIALKCSDLTFLNKLISRMCRLLHDTSFADKLDSKRHLLGFNDGVYDFEQMLFRPAVQTDYVSMSVGYDFPKESDPVYRAKLDKFYADIQPDPIQRLYLKKVMATPLNTTSPRADFYVFSGNTRNGKSNLCDLESCTFESVDTSLNDDSTNRYATVYSPTFLTKERKGGDSPAPDLLDFRLSRVMFGNEPANDAKIQTNTMKALTGRDTWSGRYLNENKIWKFKIYAIVFMNCNDKPSMSSNEPAVWFRTKVIDFPMKFVPNPTLPHELPEDIHLKDEIVRDIGWRKEHMLMLLEIYRDELLPNGLEPPESVLAATREYCDESNPLAQWWQENTEEAATHISSQSLCNDFRSYDNEFRNLSVKAFNKRLRLELGLTIRPSIRCVDKDTPAVGIERRKLKEYGSTNEVVI